MNQTPRFIDDELIINASANTGQSLTYYTIIPTKRRYCTPATIQNNEIETLHLLQTAELTKTFPGSH